LLCDIAGTATRKAAIMALIVRVLTRYNA